MIAKGNKRSVLSGNRSYCESFPPIVRRRLTADFMLPFPLGRGETMKVRFFQRWGSNLKAEGTLSCSSYPRWF
jgi:hypothetical protein